MIHPNTELKYINDQIGYGVFATKFIPKGTITYVKDSLELEVSPAAYLEFTLEMQQVIEKYSYIDERGYRIISWDFAKYVNHCCNCNTMSTGYGFEIAIKDIEMGEQITDEYGIFNLEYEIPLSCQYKSCRKVVRPGDFEELYKQWDVEVKSALTMLYKTNQPLWGLLDLNCRKALDDFNHSSEHYRSVYALRYLKSNGVMQYATK